MDHAKVIKEQILHIVFGAVFFLIIGAFAVGLDVLSTAVRQWGVTPFTGDVLEFSAHALMVLDLLLFFIYLIVTSIELVKGMIKP